MYGSIMITSVHKLVGAKWSGVIIRLTQATLFFIPVSIVGLLLIMTVGYDDIYGNMAAALGTVSRNRQGALAVTQLDGGPDVPGSGPAFGAQGSG